MASMRSGAALYPSLSLFDGRSVAGLSEGELLERFASRSDQAAFAALVALHGPMVLATCRGVLRDPNDAEDTFQATFLALVKKAGQLRVDESIGGWLYRVAFRMALQVNDDATRRRDRERRAGEVSAIRRSGEGASDVVRNQLHAEIDRLPDRYRLPLVLCYLEGLTQDVAALRLGLSEGTLRRRLTQARERLRVRLGRGGASQTAGSLGLLLAGQRAEVPVTWAEAVVRFATLGAEGGSIPIAASWAESLLRTMHMSRLRWVGTLTLGLALVGSGLGFLVGTFRDDRPRGLQASGLARKRPSAALDGPLAPLGQRLYVSGVSWFADVAPEDHWKNLVIDIDRGTARQERTVADRASIWRAGDGAVLAWSRVGSPDGSLWARDARGKDSRVLDGTDPESSCSGVHCALSPDGKRFVAATLGLREGRRVFTTWRMNMDGTERVRLPLEESEMVADWSPDGERLLIVSEGRGPTVGPVCDELSLASPDGKRTRRLLVGRMFIHPRFSPDGNRIAYVGSDPVDGRSALMVIDVEGTNLRSIMGLHGLAVGQICWSPDGTRLALNHLTRPGEVPGPQVSLVEVVDADGANRRKLTLPIVFTDISELNWR